MNLTAEKRPCCSAVRNGRFPASISLLDDAIKLVAAAEQERILIGNRACDREWLIILNCILGNDFGLLLVERADHECRSIFLSDIKMVSSNQRRTAVATT